jgi:hypothetical protein
MNKTDRIATLVLALLLLALLAFMVRSGGYFGAKATVALAFCAVFGALALAAKFFPGKD